MHDGMGMPYDPIQDQGHEPFKFGNSAIFKSYLAIYSGSCQLTRNSETRAQLLNLIGPDFYNYIHLYSSQG